MGTNTSVSSGQSLIDTVTTTQKAKLLNVLRDNKIHTVPEIIEQVYGINKPSSARLSARIYDLKKDGYEIISNPVVKKAHTWWYQMLTKIVVWKQPKKQSSKKPKGKKKTVSSKKSSKSKSLKKLNKTVYTVAKESWKE